MQDNIVNRICVNSNYLMDEIQSSFKLFSNRIKYQLMKDNGFERCAAAIEHRTW